MGREIDFLQFPKAKRTRVSTEKARKIARRFDKEFFDGDRENGYGGYKYDGRWIAVAKRMIDYYKLGIGDCVLDVGCGKGFLVKDFRDQNIDSYGIDISEYAIGESVTPAVEVGNAKKLVFPPRSFDLAVSINTIHNLPLKDCEQALRELMMVATDQYVVLDAWRTKEQKKRIHEWNLTAQTILSVTDWLKLFKKVGYTGDYSWTLLS